MAQPKDPPEITQPSVLLYKIKSYMTVLQSLENYIHLGNFCFFIYINAKKGA